MTELLNSIKADLLDRRLRPVVGLVLVALVAAVAYVALGGGSGSSTPTAVVGASAPSSAGIAVAQVQTSPNQAAAETTIGVAVQHRGKARDPFALLPGTAKSATVAKVTTTSASSGSSSGSSSSSSSASSGSSSTSSSGSSGSGSSSSPSTTKPAAKSKTIYKVALQFGPLPEGVAPGTVELKSYADLSKITPLPSAKERLIEYLGVTTTSGGKSASFALSGEAILHGSATCRPSPTQCVVIDLRAGKTEQLEFLSATGEPIIYELRVVSIAASSASAASVKGLLDLQSSAVSKDPLGAAALKLSGLSYSSQAGVLVLAGHSAFAARARAAVRHARHGG